MVDAQNSRWEKVAEVLRGPVGQFPWEAVAVDGSRLGEFGELGELTVSVSLYPDGVVNIARFVEPSSIDAEFMDRIGRCAPSVETLYRMEVQRYDLVANGQDVYASDDQRARNEAILATATETLAGTDLPMAFACQYMMAGGVERIIFFGLHGVSLGDLWTMYKAAVVLAKE